MPRSIDVPLPRDRAPTFPERCVVCSHPRPNDQIVVSRRAWSLVELVMPWAGLTRKPIRIAVNACGACVAVYGAQRRRRILVFGAAMVGAIAITFTLVPKGRARRSTGKWIGAAVGLAVLIPMMVWFPLPFDITVHANTVDYEFRDRRYAEEFARLNGAEIS